MDTLLICGAIGPALFVVLFLRDGASRPGYRAVYHTVSALALGPRGWLQTGNFVVSGALIGASAPAIAGSTELKLLPVLTGALGLALIGSGAFRMDPMRGYPPGVPASDPETFSGSHRWHDRFGALVFALLPAIPAAATFTLPALGWQIGSGVVAAATTVFVFAFGSAWERDSARTGLLQRLALASGLLWLAALCGWLATA